jgi:hypothetical protein
MKMAVMRKSSSVEKKQALMVMVVKFVVGWVLVGFGVVRLKCFCWFVMWDV